MEILDIKQTYAREKMVSKVLNLHLLVISLIARNKVIKHMNVDQSVVLHQIVSRFEGYHYNYHKYGYREQECRSKAKWRNKG